MAVIAPFLQQQLYDEAVNEMADELRLKANILDSSDSDTLEDTSKRGNQQLWNNSQEQQVLVPKRNVEALRRRKRTGAPSGQEKVSNWLLGSTDWSRQFQRSYTTGGAPSRLLKHRNAAGGLALGFSAVPLRHVVSRDLGSWWLRFNLHGRMDSAFPVIAPHTWAKTAWDLFIMVLVLYNSVLVPLAFSYGLPDWPALFILEWVMTFLYLVDMAVSFRTGYYDDDGNVVRDSWPVARNYLKTWFLIDFFATVPFDAIGAAAGMGSGRSQLMILAFLKTPRLLRLIKMSRLLDRIRNGNLLRVLQLFLLMLMIAHWLACTWYIISEYAPQQEQWGFDTLHDGNKFTWYLSAFYSSFLLLVGDNAVALNNYERVFFVVALLCGACFYSAVVGNMALLVANLNTVAVRYRQRLDMTQDALRYMRVPEAQIERVQAFYDYITSFNHPSAEGLGFLSELTKGINEDLHMFLHEEPLKRIYLFKDCETAFIRSLGMRMKIVTFIPREIIFRQGDLGHEMYIIRGGCVAVVSKTKEMMSMLKAGDFFGEIALLTQARRTAECIALTNCDLAVLNSIELKILMKEFPDSAHRLQAAARERLHQLQIAGRAGGRQDHDLSDEEGEEEKQERAELRRARMKAIARFTTDRAPSVSRQAKQAPHQAALIQQLEELRVQAALQEQREWSARQAEAAEASAGVVDCGTGSINGFVSNSLDGCVGDQLGGGDSNVAAVPDTDTRERGQSSGQASRRSSLSLGDSAQGVLDGPRRGAASMMVVGTSNPAAPGPSRPASAPRQVSVSSLLAANAARTSQLEGAAPNATCSSSSSSSRNSEHGMHVTSLVRRPSPRPSDAADAPMRRRCVSATGTHPCSATVDEGCTAQPPRTRPSSPMPGLPLADPTSDPPGRSSNRAQRFLRSNPGESSCAPAGAAGHPALASAASKQLPPNTPVPEAPAQFDAVEHFQSPQSSLARSWGASGGGQEEEAAVEEAAEEADVAAPPHEWQVPAPARPRGSGPVSEGVEGRALSFTKQAASAAQAKALRPTASSLQHSLAAAAATTPSDALNASLHASESMETRRGLFKAAVRGADGGGLEAADREDSMRSSLEATASALRELQLQQQHPQQSSFTSSHKASSTGYTTRPAALIGTATTTARERRRSHLGPHGTPFGGPTNPFADLEPPCGADMGPLARSLEPPLHTGAGLRAAAAVPTGNYDSGPVSTPSEPDDSRLDPNPSARTLHHQSTSFAAALAATAASVAARVGNARQGGVPRSSAQHPNPTMEGSAAAPMDTPSGAHHGVLAHVASMGGAFGLMRASGLLPGKASEPQHAQHAEAHMRSAAARRAEGATHHLEVAQSGTPARVGTEGAVHGGHAFMDPSGSHRQQQQQQRHREDSEASRGSLVPAAAHSFFSALIGGGRASLRRFATTEISAVESSSHSTTDGSARLAKRISSVTAPQHALPRHLEPSWSGGNTATGNGDAGSAAGDVPERPPPAERHLWRSRTTLTPLEANRQFHAPHGHSAQGPDSTGEDPGTAPWHPQDGSWRPSDEAGEEKAAVRSEWVRVSRYRLGKVRHSSLNAHSSSGGVPSGALPPGYSLAAPPGAAAAGGGPAMGGSSSAHGSGVAAAAVQGVQGAGLLPAHLADLTRREAEVHRRESQLLHREGEVERREGELAHWRSEAARWQAEAAQHQADAARCRAEVARCQEEMAFQLQQSTTVHTTVVELVESIVMLSSKVEDLEARLEDADATAARIEGQHVHGHADFLGLGAAGHLALHQTGDIPTASASGGGNNDRTSLGDRPVTAGADRQASANMQVVGRRTSLLHYNVVGSTSRRFTDAQPLLADRGGAASGRLADQLLDSADIGDKLTGGGGDKRTPRNGMARRLSLFMTSHSLSNNNNSGSNASSPTRLVTDRRLSLRPVAEQNVFVISRALESPIGAQSEVTARSSKRSTVNGDRPMANNVGAKRWGLLLGGNQQRRDGEDGVVGGPAPQQRDRSIAVERAFGFSSGRVTPLGTGSGDMDSRSNSLAASNTVAQRRWSMVKEATMATAVVIPARRGASSSFSKQQAAGDNSPTQSTSQRVTSAVAMSTGAKAHKSGQHALQAGQFVTAGIMPAAAADSSPMHQRLGGSGGLGGSPPRSPAPQRTTTAAAAVAPPVGDVHLGGSAVLQQGRANISYSEIEEH
ncbi:hypothetical protein Agub_g10192 [Astrephomene gubernaculifera]|uniref:Cyclic nucleotide-binding domain-containing protein n=1 Tax=Astrephomene gubernaculifera TaxID=47775 RepID=A0AAD3DUL8_9CHLO|nr:hypothetical protein Agub_g10192 [Astrephomene gubernaculifera]